MSNASRSSITPRAGAALLVVAFTLSSAVSCGGDDAVADGARFAECITLPGTCLTSGPSATVDQGLAELVRAYLQADRTRSAKGAQGDYKDDLAVRERWIELYETLRKCQAEARAASPGRPIGVATVRLVEPESGPVADDCAAPSGVLTSGDYLDADLSPNPGQLSELSIRMDCPAGEPSPPACRADVEITSAGGPDGRGTGLDLILRDIPVRMRGPLWVFQDPAPGRNPTTLFAVLYDCGAGFGILSWGSLAKYDTSP